MTAMTEAVQAPEPGVTVQNQNSPDEVADEPAHRKAARYVWALLLARNYDRRKSLWDEVLPLICPKCGGDMRIIAFMAQGHAVNEGPVIREILGHLGEPISAPCLAPARCPPLWELLVPDQAAREIDPQAQPAPDYEFDQRVAW